MSQTEVNKTIRVLQQQKPLKYTVQLHYPDGRVVEWQASKPPKVSFYNEARAMWLIVTCEYTETPVCAWPDGGVLLVEENPGV